MNQFRTPNGGLTDRSKTLRFRFNGKEYTGHPGDTLASALLANGRLFQGNHIASPPLLRVKSASSMEITAFTSDATVGFGSVGEPGAAQRQSESLGRIVTL